MDYNRLAATAARLIQKNGALTLFHKLETIPSDLAKPWRGSTDVPPTTVTIPAVFVHPVSEGMRLGISGDVNDLAARFSGFVITAPPTPNYTQDLSKFNLVQRSVNEGKSAIEFVEVLKPASVVLLYIYGIKR